VLEAAMLFRHILIGLVLAAVAGVVVVVPFIRGFVRGPQAGQSQSSLPALDDPMRPLKRVAGIYGSFLLLYLVAIAFQASYGLPPSRNSLISVCVDTGYSDAAPAPAIGERARPGAVLVAGGNAKACALHPSLSQWVLYLLTKLPALVLWGCLLLLIWRLISEAARRGPFTPRAAAIVWLIGWTVLGGSYVVGALDHLGADVMTRMLVTPGTVGGGDIVADVLILGPIEALLPVPVLVGAALLTFARITRAGVVLDDEVKATV
jgi:hypothetical protein